MEMHRSSNNSTQRTWCRVLESEEDEEGITRQLTRTNPQKRRRRTVWFAGILVILGTASAVAVLCRGSLVRTATKIGHLPRYQGGAFYSALVTLWLLALLPTSLLEVLGGFIFGMWLAALCSTIGKVTGSFISFAIGRKYKRFVQSQLIEPHGYIAGLQLAITQRPFSTCLALRLAYVPEAVQNYTPAILDAPFPPFAAATIFGGAAYALLWAKLGASLQDVKDIIQDGMSTEKLIFILVGAISLVLFLLLIHFYTTRLINQLSQRGGRDNRDRDSSFQDDELRRISSDDTTSTSIRRSLSANNGNFHHFALQQRDDDESSRAIAREADLIFENLPAHHPPLNPGASLSETAASLV
uniref:VTT domain-containing protein n=1 Tax=Aureoumbra lagunensis TaxID=44058 RepID=A0A7S3K2L4_9STRA|mmetsp:Transcript_6891/g.9650  ORF Transcript_6891/g.9650 Transcript_6891/m.9650 type:complete len:356 (-) Transcript_6891:55-1122(-)